MNPEIQKEREQKGLVDSQWIYRGRILQLQLETYQWDDVIKKRPFD